MRAMWSLELGVRAVQATPLWSPAGELVGMLSTHYRRTHRPEEHDLQLLDVLGRLCSRLHLAPQPPSPATPSRRVVR